MKKHLFFSAILLLAIMSVSCIDQYDLTERDKTYIFLFEDIENLDISEYQTRLYKNNKEYIFLKGKTKFGEYNYIYDSSLLDKDGNVIRMRTNISLLLNINRAKRLFESCVGKSLYKGLLKNRLFRGLRDVDIQKKYLNKISPEIYSADQLLSFTIEGNYFFIVLRKGKLVYSITVEGVFIDESQIRDNLNKKLLYIEGNEAVIKNLSL